QVLIPQAWHGHEEWIREVRLGLGEGIVGTVAQRREGMIVEDYRTSRLAHPALKERNGATTLLAEPLLYRDRLVGVLVLLNPLGVGKPFTVGDRNLLMLFAAQAAIAIENARRHGTAEPSVLDRDRKSTRLNSSHVAISYAVFCSKKKK